MDEIFFNSSYISKKIPSMSITPIMNIYYLYDEDDKIMETSCSCVEKALDYFKEMGHDVYQNKDLSIKTKTAEAQACEWDSWHPHF
jgi:hypothetical protein